uniref:pectinesterase n=1 Tax=Oryza punctata TaxID=4537 RepID=A0A0E0MDC8_ORYPU
MAENRSKMMLLLIIMAAFATTTVGSTDSWVRRRLLLIGGTVNGRPMKKTVVVAKDRTGNFTTITEALGAAPARGRYGIFVKAGVYEETVNISRHNVVLWGEGIGKTVITGSRSCAKGKNNTDMPWTATVTVIGHGFIAQDITIENKAGPTGTPAVALRCDSNKALIHRCRIEGHQDTLWAQNNLQVYLRCDIAGTIDFVYGNAKAIFQHCRLLVRNPGNGKHNAITAQGRDDPTSEESGFVFQGCNITAMEGESLAGVDTYLGRPWKNHSRVVFMGCYMTDIINPDGWVHWNREAPVEQTTRTVEYLEYGNTGAGAKTRDRVKWKGVRVITAAEANRFTVDHFINGDQWLPNLVNGQQINYTHGLN